MELRPEQLVDQISTQALAPVYLITGPEPLRVLEAADAVRKQARAEGISERDIFQADARDFDWRHLAARFQAPSLFSQRRLLELRLPSAKPGKDGAQVISDFARSRPMMWCCSLPANNGAVAIRANGAKPFHIVV